MLDKKKLSALLTELEAQLDKEIPNFALLYRAVGFLTPGRVDLLRIVRHADDAQDPLMLIGAAFGVVLALTEKQVDSYLYWDNRQYWRGYAGTDTDRLAQGASGGVALLVSVVRELVAKG